MFEKLLRATLVVCVVLMLALAAQAGTITVGDPLIPTGLLVGNTFHIAFQTEGTSTAATSTDIAYYNADVQASANSAGSLFLGRGWNWYCIGSTSTVDARDNAVVSAPVYIESKGNSSTNPLTQILVANNYTDFWDGNHAQSIYQDNDGVHGNGGPWVLTGTNTNGTRYVGYELGSAVAVRLGDAWVSSSAWVSATDTLNKGSAVLYALSEPLTVIAPGGNFWDGNGAGAGGGGPGNWTSNSQTFATASGGVGGGATQGTGTIVFGDTAGEVVVTGASVAADAGMEFKTDGYTLKAVGGASLALGGPIEVGSSKTATITAPLSGNTGLTKIGDGKLVLGTASEPVTNLYTGGTIVSAGTLEIGSLGALPAGGALTISAGATVVLSSGLSVPAAGSSQAAAVPEPGTIGLLAAGLARLLVAAWRRRL